MKTSVTFSVILKNILKSAFFVSFLISFLFVLTANVEVKGQCIHTISLRDTYGDGWNGGKVTVYVNGSAVLSAITLSSGSGPTNYTFSAATGASIQVSYTAGSWAYENYYTVTSGTGSALVTDWYPSSSGTWYGTGACPAACTPPSAPGFGSNIWNVLCYEGNNFETFKGYYTENNLNFNSANRWGTSVSPSSANSTGGSAYNGCPISNDNHSYIYKRQGFPSGNYSINVNRDDDYILFVNGTQVSSGTCCGWTNNAWTGTLNSSSTVEIRFREYGGGSQGEATFTVPEMMVPSSGSNSYTVCSGHLYDNGGSASVYAASSNGYSVIYPGTAGNNVQLTGTYYSESNYDYIYIYNGVGTSGTLLYSGSASASTSIGTITSTDVTGALTVKFTSDGSVQNSGFDFTISCVAPCVTPGTPINLSTSVTGTTTATCSWAAGSPAGSATVNYYISVFTTGGTQVVAPTLIAGTVANITGLTCGTDYYFRVYANTTCNNTSSAYAQSGNFTTSACPPPPANDACSNSTVLSCGTSSFAGTTVNSVYEAPPGGYASGYGVWYTFTGDGNSTTISSSTTFDHELDFFSGSCGGLTAIAQIDNSTGTESYTFTPTNGVQYYIYVAHYSISSTTTGTFTISRTCVAPPPATPGTPTSNSPGCGSVTITRNGTPPAGESWYWQTSATGTSTANAGSTYTVTTSGTYYIRSYRTSDGMWSSAASIAVTVDNAIPTSVSAGSDIAICNSANTQLNGSANSPTVTGSITFNYSGSGYDCDYFLIGGTSSGAPDNATITNITYSATIGSYCSSWYEWDLFVNSNYIVSGCDGSGYIYSGLNGQPVNGQLLQIRSWDNDDYCDYVNMTFSVTIDYSYTPELSYLWTPAVSLNNATIANPTATPASTTTYTMTASIGSCSVSDDVIVTVRPNFTAGAINTNGETICSGGNPAIIGSSTAASGGDNSITYEWRAGGVAIPGANAETYDPASGITTTTTFTRWAHDNTCNTSWAQSTGSYTVTVQTPPQPEGLASGDYFWTGAISDSWNSNENWLYFNGTSYSVASVIPDANSNVFIQSYSGTCATTNAVTNASSVVYANDVNIASGLTLGGLSNLQVNGDWNNSGTFIAGTGTVAFVGNSVQTINPGASSFNNIVLANTAATNSDIIIDSDITINGNLALTSGILNANGHTVNFGSAASVTENSSSSFVHGKMIRTGDSPFKFPTGDVIDRDMDGDEIAETHVVYTPFEVNPESMATVEVEYFYDNTGMPDWWEHGGNMDASLHHVSDREHWIVNSDQSLSNTKIYWVDNAHVDGAFCVHGFDYGDSDDFIASDLAIAYWSSTLWRNASGTVSGDHDNGSITSSYIPFGYKASTVITFGSKNNLNPLPVELIAYKAECNGESTDLYWATASEVNNDYFVLQRSTDAQNFTEMARIIGHGNSNVINYYSYKDTKQESGTVYYRLVQYDYDGASEILGVVQSNCNDNVESVASVEVSPNPFRDYVNIYLNNFNTESKVVYEIVDQYGRVLVSEEIVETDHKTIYLQNLKPGLYMLRVFDGEKVFVHKIIKN